MLLPSARLATAQGTCQWSWGLDPHHDSPAGVPPHVANPYVTRVGRDLSGPDLTVQQSTANLFADMGPPAFAAAALNGWPALAAMVVRLLVGRH